MIFPVHKNTVRSWVACGLEPIDNRRPMLFLGSKLSGFIHARRLQSKRRCRPGLFYCMRCRAPRAALAQRADYQPTTSSSGNLRGICADCGARMYRRTSLQKLAAGAGELQVQLPHAQQRIGDCSDPSLNSDSAREADTHANAQSGK
jgi:hypothetical protein